MLFNFPPLVDSVLSGAIESNRIRHVTRVYVCVCSVIVKAFADSRPRLISFALSYGSHLTVTTITNVSNKLAFVFRRSVSRSVGGRTDGIARCPLHTTSSRDARPHDLFQRSPRSRLLLTFVAEASPQTGSDNLGAHARWLNPVAMTSYDRYLGYVRSPLYYHHQHRQCQHLQHQFQRLNETDGGPGWRGVEEAVSVDDTSRSSQQVATQTRHRPAPPAFSIDAILSSTAGTTTTGSELAAQTSGADRWSRVQQPTVAGETATQPNRGRPQPHHWTIFSSVQWAPSRKRVVKN